MPALNLDTATPDEIVAWMTRNRVTKLSFLSCVYEVHPIAFAEDAKRSEEERARREREEAAKAPAKLEAAPTAEDEMAEWDRAFASNGRAR